MPHTYYEILGVSEQATSEEIEAAFKSRAGEVHPDRVSPANPYLRSIVAEAFKNLSEAKAVLVDVGKRQKYDADLASSRASSSFNAGSGKAYGNAAPAAPHLPSHSWRLAGLLTLGIALAAILLAGGAALYRAKPAQVPAPTQATPGANPPENQPSQMKGAPHGAANARRAKVEPPLPVPGSNAGKSPSVVLWRASEPPDLSSLNAAERQAIEQTCFYAKQMEGPEAYNGCLLKELTARGQRIGDQH